MASVNKVILVGHLGHDPSMRQTQGDKAIANMSLATQEKWGKGDDKQEKTEWHKVVAFDRLAEICGEYLKKGSQVYFEGRLQTRSWEDKGGNKKYATEIIATSMQMLGGGGKRDEPRREEPSIPDDDIPF